MLELETIPCRHRGPELSPGRYDCTSGKLLTPRHGVDLETCQRCYCRDHEPVVPVAIQRVPQNIDPSPFDNQGVQHLKTCQHRINGAIKVNGKAKMRES